MNIFKRLCVIIVVSHIVLSGFVNASASMSLDEAVALALQNDAQRQAEIFGAQARKADGWQAVAGYGPSMSVSGTIMNSRDSVEYGEGPDLGRREVSYADSEVTVALMQPLVDLEKLSIAYQGRREMTVADLLVKKANEDLILRVHERYYAVLSSQENLNLVQAECSALLSQVNHVKAKLQLGFGTITDQYEADARYRLSLASEIMKRKDFENTVKALEEIVASPVRRLEDLKDWVAESALPRNKKEWVGLALVHNTDLLMKNSRLEISRLHLRAVKSRFLPRLSVFADYTFRDADDGLLGYGEEKTEFDAGVRLEINVLAGGTDTAAAASASKRVQEARNLVTAAERSVERSVSSLWDSIHDTELLIESYRQAVRANRLAMESTQAAYDEGVKPLVDLLNAQQEYFRALRLYKTSRYEYMVLLQKFRQVVGVDLP